MKLKPALMFGEHMVLQRDKEIKIFGTTAIGDTVTVTLGEEAIRAPAATGVWMAVFGKREACDQTTLTITSAVTEETISFKDVAIGEVWLAGGQSNMEFIMKFDVDFPETALLPDDDKLRYFCYPQAAYKGFLETEDDCPNWGFWRKWNHLENRQQFSAVAGYMAMALRKELNVPIGIIACNWGGTPAAAWTGPEDLKENPALKKVLEWQEEELKKINWPKYYAASEQKAAPKEPAMEAFYEKMMMGEDISEFMKDFDPEALMKVDFVPFMPGPRSTVRPSGLYENMLCKVAPYTIRGALWYQGEDDDARDWQDFYDESMKTLFKSWRKLWGYEFPFYQVELAPFEGAGFSAAKKYPQIRHQQRKAVKETQGAYDICILDVGDAKNIHPRRKQVVGKRLAGVVLKHTYGKQGPVADCPEATKMVRDKDTLRIDFENAAGALKLSGDLSGALKITQEGRELTYTAKTEKESLILTVSLDEKKPVEVRYCEENYCPAVIFNAEDNPAYGFTLQAQEVDRC